jgi:hypothetical protein
VEKTVEIPATLTAFGAPPGSATATVIHQTPPQRLARTFGALGMFWGLALIGLFIPLAHFILVPTFFTAGIVVAVLKAREDQRLVKVCGACPHCGVDQEFEVGGRFTRERSLVCPLCHNILRLFTPTRVPRVE